VEVQVLARRKCNEDESANLTESFQAFYVAEDFENAGKTIVGSRSNYPYG